MFLDSSHNHKRQPLVSPDVRTLKPPHNSFLAKLNCRSLSLALSRTRFSPCASHPAVHLCSMSKALLNSSNPSLAQPRGVCKQKNLFCVPFGAASEEMKMKSSWLQAAENQLLNLVVGGVWMIFIYLVFRCTFRLEFFIRRCLVFVAQKAQLKSRFV